MPVSELVQRVGSFEIGEWIAEFGLRAEDEKAAYEEAERKAKAKDPRL